MRTRTFSRDSSSLKKMVYHHDTPSATTRLPGGVTGGFLTTSRIAGSCYVIEEEQPSDCQLDDNGNNQPSELVISSSTTAVGKDVKFIEKNNYKSVTNSDNNNVNLLPRQLFPSHDSINKNNALASLQNVSSCELLDSSSSNSEADFQSQQASSETSLHDLRQQLTTASARTPHLKSGHLVLIIPEHQANLVNPKSDCPYFSSSKTLPPRCPVMVKIYDRGFEKYAIISCTRRQLALPPICLKLKHSYVTQSTTNPSCFSVVIDSSEGKTFTFEAINPDMAKEWMQAFALTDSSVNWNSRTLNSCEKSGETAKQTQHLTTHTKTQHLTTHTKTSAAVLNLSDLPLMPVLSECVEEEE